VINESVMVVEAEVVVFGVVEEVAAVPITAPEAGPEVPEAVINAAVIADAAAPEAGMPEIATAAPTPVAGGPKRADIGGSTQAPVDPVILIAIPGPVAGSPDVSVAGGEGLDVDRDCGGSDATPMNTAAFAAVATIRR